MRLGSERTRLTVLVGLCFMALYGCSNDDNPMPPTPGEARILGVPLEYGTLLEALNASSPGDTIELAASHLEVLGAPLVVASDQTPLVFRGAKNRPTVVAPANQSALVFQNPAAGTAVSLIDFTQGNPTVSLGRGTLRVNDCTFRGGIVHMLVESGATLQSERNLMRDPGLFGIQGRSAQIIAHENTVYRAGDCAMLFTGGQATVTNSVLAGSVNYGLACQSGAGLSGDSGCNDIFDSGAAPYLGCTGPEDDFFLDPGFCDAANGDFELLDISPCAPANSGGCGLVGALEVGCTTADQ